MSDRNGEIDESAEEERKRRALEERLKQYFKDHPIDPEDPSNI